ncbi:saccharopine dehydrogenase family protein [Planktothrix mougeotii]|uniref:Saccharopine dehydrogenase NADP-binding domain-containing protein n=1 Tax=Planktothrix mougeotii LEGE 06226 TaxID=1828728 RepID=A0ABR9UGR5_9CYAN|nr:saccharopine dehydrogenase NADP-binding domain-containing protein [Planktothrix mougeotii]MBE9145658.1 saccharopine dehydrogenase NADP-binding domain-containing protein [Planktothrix mougeotii LEGE 06226]
MNKQVLILGGRGRIGNSVAEDLAQHTAAEITITGRKITGNIVLNPRFQVLELDLADQQKLETAIANSDLVIHCAGPFHYRDTKVLQACIQQKVNYIDVSDNRGFTSRILEHSEAAQKAGITAIINTGIFPGISNSMVRQGVEQFDQVEKIHLSYVVGGSGGAGITVMRTTFLGLQRPFDVWINGQWKTIKPYSERETIEFPSPYGKTGVYWFDMPECFTLVDSFPAKTVITKFGTVPDFYNYLTWSVAHWWPASWLQNPAVIEFLSQVSYRMTNVTDIWSGIGVAVRSCVTGIKQGKTVDYCSTIVHENTATIAGIGTGTIAELCLNGELQKPGVWPVEQVLSTPLFEAAMNNRGINIQTS